MTTWWAPNQALPHIRKDHCLLQFCQVLPNWQQTNPATKLTNAESGQSWEEVGAPWELFHRIGPAWLDHREIQSVRPTHTSQLLHELLGNQQVTKWSNLQAKQSSLHIPTYYCWGPMHLDFGNLVVKMSTNQTACKRAREQERAL